MPSSSFQTKALTTFLAITVATWALIGCGRTAGGLTWLNGSTVAATQYYQGTEGLTGYELKARLHLIIRAALRLNYNQTLIKLQFTDQDDDHPDRVSMIYSGRSIAAVSDGADSRWNREHIWAKVRGFPHADMIPYTDLHHLRACEITVNSTRGSMDFGEVSAGRAVPEAPGVRYDADLGIFEPSDEVKGDIARVLFYMDVRYQGGSAREPDLRLVEHLPANIRHGVDVDGNGYFANLSTLIKWHERDPVDERESRRNDRVWQVQGNRNPFIDHPEFARAVFAAANR